MFPRPLQTIFPLVRTREHVDGSKVGTVLTEPAAGMVVAGRYELERQIGEGGMACVWLARDRALECACALKFLRSDLAANTEIRTRFEREAAVVARIRSRHVVRLFDRGEWQGLPFIAMEYLEGEDLGSRLLRQATLEPWQTYQVVSQIARGLTLAHARGVVHRDVKPENIFLVLDERGEVAKLLDFGIAKQVLPSPTDAATLTGLFLGTVQYASPEQFHGVGVDWRSDLWSLAVVTFECLTGRRPFEADSLGELCAAVLYEPVPRLAEFEGQFPAELEAWFERALARDPECRFQSAREFADALADAVACVRATVPNLPPRATLETLPDNDVSSAVAPSCERRPFRPSRRATASVPDGSFDGCVRALQPLAVGYRADSST
jgi:serine/threonine-protein kinase